MYVILLYLWKVGPRLILLFVSFWFYLFLFVCLFVCLFVFGRNPYVYRVVVGDHNRNTNEGTEQEVLTKRIISHAQYNKPGRLNNDIALIQLASSVKLSQRVNPICLPSNDSDVPTGSKCYITG